MSNNQNLATVRAIGKGVRLTEQAVPAIIALAPEGFDPKKRGAVADLVHTWAGFPNKDNRPAVTTGGKGEQKPTDYGTGHDTLVRAVKREMTEKVETVPDYLALVISAANTARDKGNVDAAKVETAIREWAKQNLS